MASLLEARAEEAGDGAELAGYLSRLAEIQVARLSRPDLAVGSLRAAFEADPEDPGLLRRARALAEAGGDLGTAATLLEREAEATGGEKLGPAFLALGRRLADEPWHLPLARRLLERAKGLGEADHVDETLGGLDQLAKTWKDEARRLRTEAVEARDKRKAAAAYLRIAQLHALYDDAPQKVAENLERVFLLHPGSIAALDFLEGYHGGREDWPGLVAAYERVAEKVKDRAVAADVWVRVARLQAERLIDAEAAAVAWRRALDIDPTHAEAAAALVGALEAKGAWTDAAAVLEKRLAAVGERGEQVRIRLQLARLCLRRLDDAAAARDHLEAVLRLDPANLDAATELEPLYREAGADEALAGVLAIRVGATAEADARRRLLEELATLEADALGHPEQAVGLLARALVLAPGRKQTLAAFEDRAVGDPAALAVGLAVAADAAVEPGDRVALLRRLAEVREAQLEDPAGAAEVYRALLDAAPGDEAATAGLERVLEATGADAELTEALRAQAKDESDPAKKRDILLRLARHYDRAVEQPEKALEILRRLLEQDPGDGEVAERRLELLTRSGDWPAVADALRARVEAAGDDASPALKQRLAEVLATHLDAGAEAVELYGALLAAEPRRLGVADALEALLARGVEPARIAALLEPAYAAAGDWLRHLAMLEQRLAHTDDEEARAALLERMAEVHETHLADKRQALMAVARACKETPADGGRLDHLERLARETGAFGEYEQALTSALLRAPEMKPDVAMTLRTRLADLRENSLGDAEGAAEVWEQILAETTATDPAYRPALEAVARIARENERWQALAAALDRLAPVANDPAAVRLELGSVRLERLGDAAGAAEVFRAALDDGAPEAEVLPLLSDALERAADSKRLASVLERRIALAERGGEGAAASRLKLRLARIQGEGLGQTSEAVASYRAVLDERPGDPDALTALEALLDDPANRLDAARALAPAYERAQEYAKLVRALEVEAESAGSPAEEAEHLRHMAEVQERHLRRKADALETLRRAVVVCPQEVEIRAELRRLADEIGALERVPVILDEASTALEGMARLALMREAAEWVEKRQGDRTSAVARYAAMLEVDDENLDALMSLHRLHRAAEDWSSLAATCLRLAEVTGAGDEKVRLWREAGRLFEERLGDPAAAAAAYRKILEADPSDAEAARVLDRLYGSLGRHADLAWVLDLERQQAGEGDRRQGLTGRLADVYRRHLGRLDEALALYGELLTQDPAHPPTRQALSELVAAGGAAADRAVALLDPQLEALGEHRARIDLREARLARADADGIDAERRAALFAEIRRLYERELGATEMAFMTACRQLTAGVDPTTARDEAARLAREAGTLEELAEVFDEVSAGLADDDPQKVELLRQEAAIRTETSELPDDAIEVWKKIQALQPQARDVLDALEALYNKRQDAQDLVDLYRQKVDLASGDAERLAARLDLGRLLEQTGAAGPAADEYEAVAAHASRFPAEGRRALEQLDGLYARAERWQDLSRVLASLVKLFGDDPGRFRYMLRLGELFESHDAHPSRALDLYGAILDQAGIPAEAGDAPGRAEALGAVAGLERLLADDSAKVKAAARLETVYRDRMEGRPLIDVLEIRFAATRAQAERLKILQEIARLYEVRLGQKPMAFMVWCRAFREASDDAGVRSHLEDLGAQTESWEELAGVYEDEIGRLGAGEETAPARQALHARLVDIYEHRLAQPEPAGRHQRAALDLAGEASVEDLERLARLLRDGDDRKALVAVYRELVARLPDGEHKKELWYEIAGLTEEVLGDPAAAVAAYQQVLALSGDRPDPEVLGLLERLLTALERWDALCEVLDRQAALAAPGAATAERRHQVGRVRQVRQEDPVGAVADYAAALEADPDHRQSLGALEELLAAGPTAEGAARDAAAAAATVLGPRYAAEGDTAGRIRALEVLAAAAPDAEARAARLAEVGSLYADDQDSPEMAFMAVSRALSARPGDAALLARLHALAEAAELQEEEIELLQGLVPSVRDEALRADYHRRLGQLLSDAGEIDEALPHLRALLELVPDDAGALDRLGRLTRLSGDHAQVVEVLRRQLALTDDETERVRVLRQMGALQEEQLGDLAGALATYRRILEGSPADREALARVDALCFKQERWTELAEVLEREARAAAEDQDTVAQVGFLHRLALMSEGPLHDPDGAMSLHREVLRLVPGRPETVAHLERLLEKQADRPEVARLLEEVYRAEGEWKRLVSMLEVRAAGEPEREERVAVLWEMHQVQAEKLGSPDMAFIVLCRAFNEDPSSQEIRAALERLADVTEQHEELAAVLEDALDQIGVPEVVADMSLTVARIHEEKLRDPDAAITYYEQVLKNDPERLPALQALDRLYRAKERFTDLAGILEREAEAVGDDDERAAVLFRLGQLHAEKLDTPDRAAVVYEQLLEVVPAHLPALRALEQLYEQAGAFDKLAANLETQLGLARDEAVTERLTGRLAEVLGTSLGEHARAIGLWQTILEHNRRSEAALDALEKLYEATEAWQDLAGLLRGRLTSTVDPREITRLNDWLGWVLGAKLGEAEQATKSFKAVLERDPRNVRALEALRDIHTAEGQWEDLIAVLKRLVPLQASPEDAKAVRLRLAEVLGRELGRREEAIEATRRFLDLEPHAPDSLLPVEALLRDLDALPEAVAVMERRARALAEARDAAVAEVAPEGTDALDADAADALQARLIPLREARVALLFEIATAHAEELGKAEGGAAAYEEILSLEPANEDAYGPLRQIYEDAGRHRELASLLDRFLPSVTDPDAHKALRLEIAALQEQRLGQKELAFLTLSRAIAEDPADEAVEADLLRLAADTSAWDELASVLESVAESLDAGPRKASLLLRLASIQDRHLEDPDEAEDAIRQVLAFDPGSASALEALAELFVRHEKTRDLIVALEQKLDATGDPEEQKIVLGRIARVYETEQDDLEEAIATWRRVLELDGGDQAALDELARIFEAGERWAELIDTLQRATGATDDGRARAALHRRIGLLQEERLEDDDAAIAAFRAALEADPRDADALAALERIYTRLERWDELLKTYEAEVAVTEDAEDKVRLLLRVAALHEDQFDDADAGIDAFERVLAVESQNLVAIKGLVRLFRATSLWERLIEALERQIAVTHDLGDAVRLHIELGQVWHDQLSRVDKAEQIFNHALEIDPESRPALRALGSLYEGSGNWNLALEMMDREAKLAGMGDDAVELWYRMGRIQEDMLLDSGAARAAYEQALDIEPSYLPAIQSLKSLAELDKDWDKYLESLVQEAKHTADLGSKTRLLHQIGVFYRDQREDPKGALRYFEEALQKTEDDVPAAEAASAIHLANENFDRAEQLLRIVCHGHAEAGLEQRALCQWWYKLGYVRQKLGRTDDALDAYRRAYDCDATYLPALEGLGAALVQGQRWDEALKIFQTILIHHRESVTDFEVVEYYWQLGEINRHLEQVDRAIKNFEKALEIDPDHEAALSGIIRLHEEREEWDEALEYRQRLLEALEGDARYEMLLAIGRLAREKLEDPYQAVDAYLGAHKLKPEAVAALESLLVLYRETRQSARAVEVLEKLLDREEIQQDKAKARRYHFNLGELLRDDLKDADGALAHFDAALDVDYTFAKAFVAIEEILGRARRFPELEQAYVRMVQRIPKTPQTHAARMGLWKTLGELYRKVLKNLDGAIAAYQVVCKGDKDDTDAVEILAELLAQKPGAEKQAAEAFHQALKVTSEPTRVARALLRLYSAEKNYDKAYGVAAVIVHLLGDAEPDEQRLYDRLKPYATDQAQRTLTDRLWEQHLYHEKLKGPVADILAILYEQAGSQLAADPKELGLNPRRDLVDPASSMLYFANMYRYVGRVLGMEGVPLYKQAQQGEGLALAFTSPVSLIANEDMLGRSKKRQLWFTIAKALAFTRPELALGRTHSLEDLDLLIQAAASLVNPGFPVSLDPREVQKVQKKLQRGLSPEAVSALTRVVRGWRPDKALADLRAYAEGVEHTANRAGILLAGDVEVARACLMEDRGGAAKLPLRSKVRELVMFCLSEAYFQLRQELGIALQIPGQGRS